MTRAIDADYDASETGGKTKMLVEIIEATTRGKSGLYDYLKAVRRSSGLNETADEIALRPIFEDTQQFDLSQGRHARRVYQVPFCPVFLSDFLLAQLAGTTATHPPLCSGFPSRPVRSARV